MNTKRALGDGASARPVWVIKLGGGLITDKTRREYLRSEVLERLCEELATGCAALSETEDEPLVILGHGSGSYGHWAAKREAVGWKNEAVAAAHIADAAARLHREVMARLLEAGLAPFSWLASTGALAGADAGVAAGSLVCALKGGLLPVTMGDVVLADDGPTIWSTEEIISRLVPSLSPYGLKVQRILWLGNTDGILDARQRTVDLVRPTQHAAVEKLVFGSEGVDVTGGMRLRFETCRELARHGVESWILDGTKPGVLEQALGGKRVGGTEVSAILDGAKV